MLSDGNYSDTFSADIQEITIKIPLYIYQKSSQTLSKCMVTAGEHLRSRCCLNLVAVRQGFPTRESEESTRFPKGESQDLYSLMIRSAAGILQGRPMGGA